MDNKENSKFLYFDNNEIEKEETDNKQVFVTKRMRGKETHNIKKQIKVEKSEKVKKQKFDKIELKDDEFIIDISNKYIVPEDTNKNNKSKTNKKEIQSNKSKSKNRTKKKNNTVTNNRKPSHSNRLTTNKVKRNNKKKKNKNIVKIFTLLFIIIAIGIFTMITPIFNITKIEVIGNEKVNTQSIISLSGLQIGENIFKNLKGNVIRNIKENAYVGDVAIKLKLPGTVSIEVTEREIKYQLKVVDSYVYIDNQGYILEISNIEENVPIIEGYKTGDNEILKNKRLDNEDLLKLNSVSKIMNSATNIKIDSLIKKINIEDSKEYILFLENKQIYIGDDTNLSNKMGRIQMILEDVKEAGGIIFVNGDFNDGFKAYFRPQ